MDPKNLFFGTRPLRKSFSVDNAPFDTFKAKIGLIFASQSTFGFSLELILVNFEAK